MTTFLIRITALFGIYSKKNCSKKIVSIERDNRQGVLYVVAHYGVTLCNINYHHVRGHTYIVCTQVGGVGVKYFSQFPMYAK